LLAGTVMVGLGLAGLASSAAAQDEPAPVMLLDLDGVVDPFVAAYVEDGIADAADEGARAVVLRIDTPGGLDSAMRRIVKAVLGSDVPVLCWVGPPGARAASAGTFVLLSCPVAAMAPATNVGAAHPVGISGAIESEKATNDAAKFIVSLAERYGRNAEWAESAVRDAISASAEEARSLGVVDMLAEDVPALLAANEGRTVELGTGGTATLEGLAGAPVQERAMGWGVGFLHDLIDPNLAFLFFYLGLALMFAELFVPGLVLGTIGLIMVVLSVVALGMLPVQPVGVALIIASLVLFILELKVPGVGISTAAGVICLVLGGLFLFDPAVPSARVSPWMIAPVAVFAAAFFTVAVRAAIRMRTRPSVPIARPVLGSEGIVVRDLDPDGIVRVAAEDWTAASAQGTLRAGTRVRVVEERGLRLVVEPAGSDDVDETEPLDAPASADAGPSTGP
jgi:membrane-bound serine protease (ClpP class)